MKQLFTLLVPLLTTLASHAQTTTYTFSTQLTAASPTTAYFFSPASQLTVCKTKMPATAGSSANSALPYQAYVINTGNSGASCLTLTFTPTCSQATTSLLAIVFAGDVTTYLAAAALSNPVINSLVYAYQSDGGRFQVSGTSSTFSIPITSNQTLTLLVQSSTKGAYCDTYALTATLPAPLAIAPASSPSQALAVYPNPATDQATFTSPVPTTLTVRDALGRPYQVLRLAAGTQPLSLAAWPAGVYLLTDETSHRTTRLLKQGDF